MPIHRHQLNKLQPYTGIAGVVVILAGVGVGMRRVGLGFLDQRPISNLGVNPHSAFLFSSSLLLSAVLFLSFGYYVQAKFHVHNRFMAYFLIGQLGQIIAAIVPYGGRYKIVHTLAAFTLAFSLPFLIRQFTQSQSQSPRLRLYRGLLRLEQATFIIGIGLFIFIRGIAPLGEALPAVGFYIWVIAVTISAMIGS